MQTRRNRIREDTGVQLDACFSWFFGFSIWILKWAAVKSMAARMER